MKRMGIGLQMYTVRENTAKDFKGTLREVAAMGYEGVEFAGYGDLPAEELRDLLQELNLTAIGSHVGYHKLLNDLEGEITYLKTIGAKYAIVPHLAGEDRDSEAKWLEVFANFRRFGEAMKKEGLVFAYHNHAFEFEDKIDGQFVFDAMYEQVPAEFLQVEMDLGWVQYAGQQPLEYVAKYAGRLPLLHLKDFRKGKPGEKIDTVELGQGDLALLDVIEAGSKADVEWIIVEQDTCANPPLQSVDTSMRWLKDNYLNHF